MTGSVWKSRTVWACVAMVAMNAWQGLQQPGSGLKLDPQVVTTINGILAIAAAYFRINPQQNLYTSWTQSPTL